MRQDKQGLSFVSVFRRCRNKLKGQQDCNVTNNKERLQSSAFGSQRALPSPPENDVQLRVSCEDLTLSSSPSHNNPDSPLIARDFLTSIEQVKDCGWYWGPLPSDEAEVLLKSEPDGSFIVRDSSDDRYFFSLTFKLNNVVRHVRIEHDQGNFSFGPWTHFKSSTIVDFVENAVAHSRSGRYLFFLRRKPVLGPLRVQLLHPCSRFRHPRSLKHMCRFVILKNVRRDLIESLPLPKPLQDYLMVANHYLEK